MSDDPAPVEEVVAETPEADAVEAEVPVVVVPAQKKPRAKAKAEPKAKPEPKARAKKLKPAVEEEEAPPSVEPDPPTPEEVIPVAPAKPRLSAKKKAAPKAAPKPAAVEDLPEGLRRLHSFTDTIKQIHQYQQDLKRQTYRNLLAGMTGV